MTPILIALALLLWLAFHSFWVERSLIKLLNEIEEMKKQMKYSEGLLEDLKAREAD